MMPSCKWPLWGLGRFVGEGGLVTIRGSGVVQKRESLDFRSPEVLIPAKGVAA